MPSLREIIEATKNSAAYKRAIERDNETLIERMERESKFLRALRGKRGWARYD